MGTELQKSVDSHENMETGKWLKQVFNLTGKKMNLHQEVELIFPVEKIKDSWLISQKLPSLINDGTEW